MQAECSTYCYSVVITRLTKLVLYMEKQVYESTSTVYAVVKWLNHNFSLQGVLNAEGTTLFCLKFNWRKSAKIVNIKTILKLTYKIPLFT